VVIFTREINPRFVSCLYQKRGGELVLEAQIGTVLYAFCIQEFLECKRPFHAGDERSGRMRNRKDKGLGVY
jgi:hypothetical protein